MKQSGTALPGKKTVTAIYVFVLAYTVIQLFWWGILLHQQSKEIAHYEQMELTHKMHQFSEPSGFMQQMQRLHHEERMRTLKYIGEGTIFLIIILAGASIVYRAVWKQMRLQQQQQNFLMAVTHELKSPIAIAKLNLETIRKQKHKLDEEKQDRLLDATIRETNRLDQLCNNILLASQFEHQNSQPFLEPLDLSQTVEQAIQDLRDRIQSHDILSDIEPGIGMEADKFMITLMLNNLVENAVKYAPKGTEIKVGLKLDAKGLLMRVCDEGQGIPQEERNKIFMKFYRIGNENTRKSKGSGLGLYLTRKIVEQHGGTISVSDNLPKGTCFEIRWQDYSPNLYKINRLCVFL